MGLSDLIFGRFLDWCMSSKVIARERPAALEAAHGEVLELGFGTGLNLPYYPDTVKRLTVVDPEDLMPKRVSARIAAARFPVERAKLGAEHLPFDDNRFDCAVSTFTMCSIGDVSAAMREVLRVLKPGGSFLFLEHGLSDEPSIAKWQRRLDPLQQALSRGCHLTRRIDQLVADGGLDIVRLDRYLITGMPRTHGTMFRGAAIAGK